MVSYIYLYHKAKHNRQKNTYLVFSKVLHKILCIKIRRLSLSFVDISTIECLTFYVPDFDHFEELHMDISLINYNENHQNLFEKVNSHLSPTCIK